MSFLRRLVFWVLLFAVPVQATAAPGWACAQAGHHAKLALQVEQHDHNHGTTSTDAHTHDVSEHGHQAIAPADSTEGEEISALPDAGKCSACTSCCSSGAAAPPLLTLAFPIGAAFDLPAHVSPAFTTAAGDALFRPPRTLTL